MTMTEALVERADEMEEIAGPRIVASLSCSTSRNLLRRTAGAQLSNDIFKLAAHQLFAFLGFQLQHSPSVSSLVTIIRSSADADGVTEHKDASICSGRSR
jgi:hypothetical protein